MIALRDYQTECLDAIAAAESRGVRRQLVVLPTGTGKTIVFSSLISMRPGRALVLAHRDELIEHAVDKIKLVIPNATIGVVKGERNEIDRRIIVASVQTVSRDRRLDQLSKDFRTIIVDEAHHAAADTYRKVLEAFSAFREDGPLTVGFTATADRSDKQGLDCVFEEIVYTRNILEMIKAGHLCDLRAKQVHLQADFNELHTRHGEFIEDELESMLLGANIQKHGVQAYEEHAPGRKALLFLPTVALAHQMADAFNHAGIPSDAIDGTTETEHRRGLLRQFKSGDIKVLSNCMVLTEGYDEPSADCIMMARPTKSRPLYTQIVGRGTRLYPGKDDCVVIDFVGVTSRHDLVTAASLFGTKPKPGESVCESLEREQVERENQEAAFADRGRLVAEAVDLFRNARLHWIKAGDTFTLSIGAGLVVLKPDAGAWSALFYGNDRTFTSLAVKLPLTYAQGAAEDFARKQGIKQFLDPSALWRKRPASVKQLSALRKMRILTPPTLTSGEASDLISQRIAARCS
jgi:ATP-dependent helicase IRC3